MDLYNEFNIPLIVVEKSKDILSLLIIVVDTYTNELIVIFNGHKDDNQMRLMAMNWKIISQDESKNQNSGYR